MSPGEPVGQLQRRVSVSRAQPTTAAVTASMDARAASQGSRDRAKRSKRRRRTLGRGSGGTRRRQTASRSTGWHPRPRAAAARCCMPLHCCCTAAAGRCTPPHASAPPLYATAHCGTLLPHSTNSHTSNAARCCIAATRHYTAAMLPHTAAYSRVQPPTSTYIHAKKLSYSKGIGSPVAAIPFLKAMSMERLCRVKFKCTAGAPFKSPMTVQFLKRHS